VAVLPTSAELLECAERGDANQSGAHACHSLGCEQRLVVSAAVQLPPRTKKQEERGAVRARRVSC
jgi:hypothetical protein